MLPHIKLCRNRRFRSLVGWLQIAALAALAAASAPPARASDAKSILDQAGQNELQRLVQDGRTTGVVAGILDENGGRRVLAYADPELHARPLGPDTVFEIGSITKIFNGILLADMVLRGEVTLEDPVAKFLPKSVRVPSRNGKQITLLDLATHHSGLPTEPDNWDSSNPDPYGKYSAEAMYDFLSRYELSRDPGEKYQYSNLGAGLLGHALAARAGVPYEALLRERVLAPLRMHSTVITLTPELLSRHAPGHDRGGYPWQLWSWGELHGAGALRSTVNDMLKFAAAQFSSETSPIHAAMRLAVQMHRDNKREPGSGWGLGWGIGRDEGRTYAGHHGRTYGFFSQLLLDLTGRRAVVVLTNSNSLGVAGLDAHLLDPATPLEKTSVAYPMMTAYRKNGVEAALSRYQSLKATEAHAWIFDASSLEMVATWLSWRGAGEDTNRVLQLLANEYPDLSRGHD